MARGRKRVKLPMDYIRYLYSRGYSVRMISYLLEKNLGVRVSHSTIARRLREVKEGEI